MSAFVQVTPVDSQGGKYSNVYQFAGAGIEAFRLEKGRATRREVVTVPNIDEFWAYVRERLDRQRPLWIWSYRAGLDMTVCELWHRMLDEEYTLAEPMERLRERNDRDGRAVRQHGMLVTTDPPTIAVLYHHTGCRLIWVDLRNWLDISEQELLSDDLRRAGAEPKGKSTDRVDWSVCRGGSAGIARQVCSITGFVRANDLGNFRFTAAGQSLAAYRHRFMRERILVHAIPEVRRLERDGYFTGQTEAFYVGRIKTSIHYHSKENTLDESEEKCEWTRDIYHIDVNGLYPFVMREERFPTALVGYRTGVPVGELGALDQRFGYVARVQIRSEDEEYPVKNNGQTMHCVGCFDTVLCGPELANAISQGSVVRCYELATYRLGTPFRQYVAYLWRLRMGYQSRGDKVYADLCKLLANSLHGKFSQHNPRWSDVAGAVSEQAWGEFYVHSRMLEGVQQFRSIAYNVQKGRVDDDKPGTFIAISAFVTAHGREYMRRAREIAGPGRVYYQGTDSLILSTEGYERIAAVGGMDGKRLGGWKLREVGGSAVIRNVNDYSIGGRRVKAGVVTPADAGPDGNWRQRETVKLDTALSLPDGPKAYTYERVLADRSTYVRGKIGEDGWRIPWRIG
jgi:hypothetical protein